MTLAAAAVTQWPAAASPLTADLLGDGGRLVVLGVFPTALYLGSREHHRVLPVLSSDALLLPTGLRLAEPSLLVDWGVSPGDEVEACDSAISWPGRLVTTVRHWRPAGVPPSRVALPAGALADTGAALVPFASSRALLELARSATHAAVLDRGTAHAVERLVGLGAGLTPAGDDALCGALLTLRAAGHGEAATRLAGAVAATWHRTTSISASLLDAAGRGFATPAVTALLRAVAGSDRTTLLAAVPAVLSVGHSSGADVVAGVAGAALALAETPFPDRPTTSLGDADERLTSDRPR